MRADVADTRIVAATSATLSFTGQDSDGEPADPGTVTIGVVNSQGTVIAAPGSPTVVVPDDADEGVVAESRTFALSVANTATVDRLTATWSSAGVAIGVTQHDVVGGVYATSAQIRADGDGLLDTIEHPASELIAARTEVEYQFERSCNRAFVPRFHTEIVDSTGSDTLILVKPELREVVWAEYWNGSAWTAVSPDVTAVPPSDPGLAVLPDSSWPCGKVLVGYRYGYDRCPPDLRAAAIEAISFRIHTDRSGIDPRVISMDTADGGKLQLATPGLGIWVTAIPSVDAVLRDHRWNKPAIA